MPLLRSRQSFFFGFVLITTTKYKVLIFLGKQTGPFLAGFVELDFSFPFPPHHSLFFYFAMKGCMGVLVLPKKVVFLIDLIEFVECCAGLLGLSFLDLGFHS